MTTTRARQRNLEIDHGGDTWTKLSGGQPNGSLGNTMK
jgi:hypothetical protein